MVCHFQFCIPSQWGPTFLEKKNVSSGGEYSFPLRADPIEKGGKAETGKVVSHLSVPIHVNFQTGIYFRLSRIAC